MINPLHILVDFPVHDASLKKLRDIPGVTAAVVPAAEEPRELPVELLRKTDVLFCTYPPSNFTEMGRVRWIQISSAGYTQLVGLGLPEKPVRATNALGVFDIPIAEWNIAMVVNLARDLRSMIRHQDQGVWDRDARFQREIRGAVAGLWGYGGIGRETARLAKALGLTVHVLTRTGVKPRTNIYCVPGTGDPDGTLPDCVFLEKEKETFLRGLDF
ncbi:hypothetical protein HQ590_05945, partial [bacterium]|nr:hypothetical protein [bacterium]